MSPKVYVALFIIKSPHPISVPVERKFIPLAPQFYNLSEYPIFTILTDLYYGNLDGDRNADNDNVWG